MSQPVDHDMTAVLEAIDHYSDGDVDQPQEIMVELQEGCSNKHKRLNKQVYEKELAKLQTELVKMQYWVKATGYRMIILFEGRDAAGKGGAIKRLTEPMNPRGCRVVALGTPSDQQKTAYEIPLRLVGSEMCIRDRRSATAGSHARARRHRADRCYHTSGGHPLAWCALEVDSHHPTGGITPYPRQALKPKTPDIP